MRKFIASILLLCASTLRAQMGPVPGSGGGAVGSGTALTACTSSILYADASSLLKCNPASVVNGSVSTAGRSILTIQDTISGSSATSNFLNITGTFPATLSAATNGVNLSFTGDNDNQVQTGLKVTLTPGANNSTGNYAITGTLGDGYTGAAGTAAIFGSQTGSSGSSVRVGVAGSSTVNASARMTGVAGVANTFNGGGTSITGGYFSGSGSGVAGTNGVGVAGVAWSTHTNAIGGLFFLSSTNDLDPITTAPVSSITTTGKAALVADNGSIAANIFEARDNGTAVLTIADGGLTTVAGSLITGTGLRTGDSSTGCQLNYYTNGIICGYGGQFSFSSSITSTAADTIMVREGAAVFQFGNDVNGAAIAQTLKAHDGITGSNISGAALNIQSGNGTGSGAGSQVNINAPVALASGTTAQTSTNRVTVCETKILSNTSATTTTLATLGAASNTLGGGEVHISVMANNGTTDFAGETQSATFSWTNKAGTFTTSTPTITASSASASAGAGSATIGFTLTGAASLISLKVTPVFTTIAPTLVTAYIEVINHGPGAVLCQ